MYAHVHIVPHQLLLLLVGEPAPHDAAPTQCFCIIHNVCTQLTRRYSGNEIVFPAGIMQAPVFYGPDVPQYLTYGAFAAVAGQ